MPYVFDASALHALTDAAGGAASVDPLLLGIGQLIANREACFVRPSVTALRDLSGDGAPSAWASASMATMWVDAPSWLVVQATLVDLQDAGHVPDILDDFELPYVVALASELHQPPSDAIVVTQDDCDKPDICSMVTACETLGIPWVDLPQFLEQTGLDQHCP